MSQLSPEQLAKVEEWAAEGANLNQVQDRLKADFGISLTYMEARLLLLETNIKIKDKPREAEKAAEPAPAQPSPPPPAAGEEPEEWESAPPPPEADSPADNPGVTMSVDQITLPGAMISGKVTFSDNQSATWYLDQMGRLGLANVAPTYKPPQGDIPHFQRQLERLLQQSGL